MKVLVIGGTRYFGVYLVKSLLKNGHQVTIITRGNVKDEFGDEVTRICADRMDPGALKKAFSGQKYDVVYDNIAYSSLEVKYILDTVTCSRYILTSTASVYNPYLHLETKEEEFDPFNHPLKWCTREEYPYDELKRQAESALFQAYPELPAAAVRIPCVLGEEDYTRRLYFYVEHAIKEQPMYVDNLDADTGFISAPEAGAFLAWLAIHKAEGPVNASSSGCTTLRQVLNYVEARTGKKAILSDTGEPGPYNCENTAYSLNTEKAEALGYHFSELSSWLYPLLDTYIDAICTC